MTTNWYGSVDNLVDMYMEPSVNAAVPEDWDMVWGVYEEQIINNSTAYMCIVPMGPVGWTGKNLVAYGKFELMLVARIVDYTDMKELYLEYMDIVNRFLSHVSQYGQIVLGQTDVLYRFHTIGQSEDEERNEKYLVANVDYVWEYYIGEEDRE